VWLTFLNRERATGLFTPTREKASANETLVAKVDRRRRDAHGAAAALGSQQKSEDTSGNGKRHQAEG
jgi:hypothetical protein